MVIAGAFVISIITAGALIVMFGQHWCFFRSKFVSLAYFKLCLSFSQKHVGLHLSFFLVHSQIC